MKTLQERIRHLRGATPQTKFAQRIGVTQSSLGRYERGESAPDVDFVQAVYEKLGIEPKWLIFGEGPVGNEAPTSGALYDLKMAVEEYKGADSSRSSQPSPFPTGGRSSTACDVDMVYVPLVEARLSAGTGSFEAGGVAEQRYGFRNDWISTKGQPSKMVLMRVTGESMEPEIHHGDVVLVDQSQTQPQPGALFAVGVEDLVYIKMVDTLPGKIILKSCNEAYAPLEIEARGDLVDGIRIIGKAIWLGRELR